MKTPFFVFLVIAVCLVISFTGIVTAAKVTLSGNTVTSVGDETELSLNLDEAPTGLAGYIVNLTVDPRIARITRVDYPSWASIKATKGLPEGKDVQISAVDLQKSVQSGSKNIELSKITIQGVAPGSTNVHIQHDTFDDDSGNPISYNVTDGSVVIGSSRSDTKSGTTAKSLQDVPTSSNNNVIPDTTPGVKVTYSGVSPLIPICGIIVSIFIAGLSVALSPRSKK